MRSPEGVDELFRASFVPGLFDYEEAFKLDQSPLRWYCRIALRDRRANAQGLYRTRMLADWREDDDMIVLHSGPMPLRRIPDELLEQTLRELNKPEKKSWLFCIPIEETWQLVRAILWNLRETESESFTLDNLVALARSKVATYVAETVEDTFVLRDFVDTDALDIQLAPEGRS